jgi:ubiquitin carboxyl-terminal hydrolase 25/28
MEYFTHFYSIVKAMQDIDLTNTPQELQNIVMEERARDRYTYEDLENATKTLGFGKHGTLGVEFENDVDEEFIVNAWKDCVRRAWRDPQNGSQLHREANDAFRITAEARRSVRLRKLWEAEKGKIMTPDRAYDTLEIPKETDEAMLLMVFAVRVR